MSFELFLNAAAKRNDLSFISRGTSTSDGRVLASKGSMHLAKVPKNMLLTPLVDRLLYHFGFDWLVVTPDLPSNSQPLMKIRYRKVSFRVLKAL